MQGSKELGVLERHQDLLTGKVPVNVNVKSAEAIIG